VEEVRHLKDAVVELEAETDRYQGALQQQKSATQRSLQRLDIVESKLHVEMERRKSAERKMMDAHCLLKEEVSRWHD
jgi:hypothetical protein